MAAITGERTDAPTVASAESQNGTQAARAAFASFPPIYWWGAGIALVLIVLVVSLLVWGPAMEFPSKVGQLQDDGSVKSVEISRIISAHVKTGTTWLVRQLGWII